jgi:putative DNA base modification enzyme with NMAD domain
MNSLLVRVGADLSVGGGFWNGPVDSSSCEFVYVAIPESSPVHPGLEKPYSGLASTLATFGVELPTHLRMRHMHLDPDFEHLTYGDQGERAKQLKANLRIGDLIVFYAGLADRHGPTRLVYALIGIFVIEQFSLAVNVTTEDRDINAHARRVLTSDAKDLIVRARPKVSGRLKHCVPIGGFRDRAYRVRPDILNAWGGLSVTNGYLQRSARLPRLLNPERFLRWLEMQGPMLIQSNN